MSAKSRGKSNFKVTLDTAALSRYHQSFSLLVYTALTFFVVLLIYVATKDWKGYTCPEEVDLGAVQVPSHTCRRKHTHFRRH
ncbi:hypothetical protein B5X24_HaOG201350 [Helicoverpa armigera]|nr:hypothetical protein B5X24_HaOG201350 [Helicoverpa armigera]